MGGWVAKYPGNLGNSLKVSICPSAEAWESNFDAVGYVKNPANTADAGTITYPHSNTIARTTGSWIDDGFLVGDRIVFTASDTGGYVNTTGYEVENVTALELEVTTDPFAIDLGGDATWAASLERDSVVRFVAGSKDAYIYGANTLNSAAGALTEGDLLFYSSSTQSINLKVASIGTANSTALPFTLVTAPLASELGVAEGVTTEVDVPVGTTGIKRRWELYNFFDGPPGTSDYATSRGGSNDELHVGVIDEDGDISTVRNNVIERYAFVSAAQDAKALQGGSNYYKAVINQKSPWIWWAGHDASVTTGDQKATATFPTTLKPVTESLSGGDNGTPSVSQSDLINAYDLFLPDSEIDVSILLGGGANATVGSHLIQNIAESRKDLVVCLSPERADVVDNNAFATAEQEDVIAFRNQLPSSSYGIMDSGWKYMFDKYNDVYRYVPLNGDIGGLMVVTDSIRDPWFSPAGFNRGSIKNIARLAFNPAKAERDQLYKNGINPVVAFPGQGTVLFGDKTLLTKPSAFDRINVRRLFIVLEKAIAKAAQYSLFEFNDEFTRSQFRNLIEPFLRDVQGRRGIFDFRVVCDETNNTPEVIDRNEFIGDIYVKPARSINFIQLNFVAVRTGVEFEEVVGQF